MAWTKRSSQLAVMFYKRALITCDDVLSETLTHFPLSCISNELHFKTTPYTKLIFAHIECNLNLAVFSVEGGGEGAGLAKVGVPSINPT